MESLSPEQIESILYVALPEDCELAGSAHVATIAEVSARGETVPVQPPSQAGWRLSAEAAMLTVAAAANFIKVCIEIYFTIKKKKGAPSEKEFREKAISQGAGVGESAAKLAAAVFKALQSV